MNKELLFECYVKRESVKRGYKKRMAKLWKECGPRETPKEIKKKRPVVKREEWLTELEKNETEVRIHENFQKFRT